MDAEVAHACQVRLPAITVLTLVIAGEKDPFITPQILCETAAGIHNARLVLYPKMGHPASGKHFERDVLGFLNETLPHQPHPV